MVDLNKYFDRSVKKGIYGSLSDQQNAAFLDTRFFGDEPIEVSDPAIDNVWGGYTGLTSGAPRSYYDYYYAGQDIKIYIDGTEDDPEFKNLPIAFFTYTMSQEKRPLYGFWSHTYDGILRGARIVTGSFALVTRHPDYMKNVLEKAAEARSQGYQSYRYYRDMTEDDSNIEKYWGKNMDPALASSGRNIFSTHPPFSFIIVYGVQNVSISAFEDNSERSEILDKYYQDNPLMTDINERLVESDPTDHANRLVIDAVELTDVTQQYGTDGSVIFEQYSFIARDIVSPPKTNPSGGYVPVHHESVGGGGGFTR